MQYRATGVFDGIYQMVLIKFTIEDLKMMHKVFKDRCAKDMPDLPEEITNAKTIQENREHFGYIEVKPYAVFSFDGMDEELVVGIADFCNFMYFVTTIFVRASK